MKYIFIVLLMTMVFHNTYFSQKEINDWEASPFHKSLKYFQSGGGQELKVFWKGSWFEKREMTKDDLSSS